MKKDPLTLLNFIAQTLYDKKSFNLLALDVRGSCTLTDFFLIGEGSVERHVIALGQKILEVMKEQGETPIHVEGLSQGDWVVLDYMDVIIHLFTPAMRDVYRLEHLWQEGKIIDLDITVATENTF